MHTATQSWKRADTSQVGAHQWNAAVYYNLCKILGNKAQKQGWTVHWEPVLDGPKGKLKPDLVFVKDKLALVVDPTVVWESDAACLVKAANAKVAKYSCLESQIKERFEVKEVRVFRLPTGAWGGWTPGNESPRSSGGSNPQSAISAGPGRHNHTGKPVLRTVN